MRKEGDGTVLGKGSGAICCQVMVFRSRQPVARLQALQQARRGSRSVGAGQGEMEVAESVCFLLCHLLEGKFKTVYGFWNCERACLGM